MGGGKKFIPPAGGCGRCSLSSARARAGQPAAGGAGGSRWIRWKVMSVPAIVKVDVPRVRVGRPDRVRQYSLPSRRVQDSKGSVDLVSPYTVLTCPSLPEPAGP